MDVVQVQRQYVTFGNSMYREGYVDGEFTNLQKLADESHPSFVVEVITIFFNDFDKILHDLTNAIERPTSNFNEVMELIIALKGSSSSIGVKKVKNLCAVFKNYCEEQNLQACVKCLHQVKQEYTIVKGKLETLLQMQKQILVAGGVIPVLE